MFQKILKDADEITNFIIVMSPDPVDEDLLLEYFFGCKAVLKTVDITTIRHEDENHHLQSKVKEKRYEKLSMQTMPPLVVENGKVLDGNHRLRVALKNGLKIISVYDVIHL